jgi:twitching motility two-component system response regulator PilG
VKGIVAGCTTYLTKPIKPDEFQKMLVRIMRWLRDFKQEAE